MRPLFMLLSVLWLSCAPAPLKAENWVDLERIATKGDALDKIYVAGKYAKQPDAKKKGYGLSAAKWYEAAAKQGCVPAMMALAQICEEGKIIDRDEIRAIDWYQKAAGLGEIKAFIALGDIQRTAKKNLVEAAKWYKKAAERGDVPTQALMGDLSLKGTGITADSNEARKWYQKAADKGHGASMIALGTLYEQGKVGTGTDLVQAYVWYDLAWRYGQQSFVQEFKERVARQLSKEQFTAANTLANDYAAAIEKRNGRK